MTGYTYPVVEENINFREFALRCMRAFGALADRRDDDSDIVYTEAAPPATHYQDRIKNAEAELAAWQAMTPSNKHVVAQEKYLRRVKAAEEYLAKTREENSKLHKMLDQVRTWDAPTPDHVRYKEFMEEQLTMSIDDETWSIKELKTAQEQPLAEIKTRHGETLLRAVESAKKSLKEEEARYVDRNGWIKAVVESLPA